MKKSNLLIFTTLIGLGIIGLASCGDSTQTSQTEDSQTDSLDLALQQKAKAIFSSLPESADPNSPKAVLGRKLYFETALSINNSLSCNSCHLLDQYGVDNLPTSPGHDGTKGDRNSPTVYNSSFHFAQFWDGRAANLTEQAKGPILNPIEMGLPDEKTAVKRIKDIEAYQSLFAAAFPEEKDPINYQNIAAAIAAFEETLNTPAPFDAYLAGDLNALSPIQKEGLTLFMNKACISCHMGPGLGGNMFQKFGLVQGPYWEYTHSEKQDKGKASVTNNPTDEFFFKVPSLRNIAKTGPYFHDGSVESLTDAVDIMAKTQLGQSLTPEEINAMVAFLESLTGTIPDHASPLNASK